MKILITGNSQAAGLKSGYDLEPDILDQIADIFFYVAVGGEGPSFIIENDHMYVQKDALVPNYPPWTHPKDFDLGCIHNYDAIVISALGYIDGAFYFKTPITRQGLLYDFQPKENTITNVLLSKACYRQVIHSSINRHQGVKFLVSLRENYKGRIILQPFPLISDAVINNPEWPINVMYHNPIAAHKFFSQTRDDFFQQLCVKHSVELLPYPNLQWLEHGFTPSELMSPSDGVHSNAQYGIMVMKQIVDAIQSNTIQ